MEAAKRFCNIATQVFMAEWVRFGGNSGPLWNARMPVEGRPDLVVAFPGGHRTAIMMAIRLTRSEIQLLKELTVAGEHGRTVGLAPISSAEVARLIDLQLIKRLPGKKLYVITERGRQVLVDATVSKDVPD